jgi:hypothetical protein
MRTSRWPALLLIPLLLAAMVMVDRSAESELDSGSTTTTVPADPGRQPDPLPLAAPIDAELATWYCPVVAASPDPEEPLPPEPPIGETTTTGTDTTADATTTSAPTDDDDGDEDEGEVDGGEADGGEEVERTAVIDRTVLLLTNVGEDARRASVRLFSTDGPASTTEVSVPAASRSQTELEVGGGQPAAALVELDGGGVAASLLVSGPHGSTVTPCLSQPAATWHLPAASTGTVVDDERVELDARAILHLFNPFPDDAIVEIGFVDADGPRVPLGFDAYPVPAVSVVAVELSLPRRLSGRPLFATSVRASSGQVVAAMVQAYDGSEGTEGLAVTPGAPEPARTWFFPAGRWTEQTSERYVIYNPGDDDALVTLSVAPDDPDTNGAVTPFELTVPRRGFVALGSDDEEWARVPPGVGHSVSVRSLNDRPVVALQWLEVGGDDDPGVALALGSPWAATEWIVPVVDLADTVRSVTVLNPSPLTRSRVTLTVVSDGERETLPETELAEAGRAVVRGQDIDPARAGAHVVASEAVVVSSSHVFTEAGGRAWTIAVPIAGTTVAPDPLLGDRDATEE